MKADMSGMSAQARVPLMLVTIVISIGCVSVIRAIPFFNLSKGLVSGVIYYLPTELLIVLSLLLWGKFLFSIALNSDLIQQIRGNTDAFSEENSFPKVKSVLKRIIAFFDRRCSEERFKEHVSIIGAACSILQLWLLTYPDGGGICSSFYPLLGWFGLVVFITAKKKAKGGLVAILVVILAIILPGLVPIPRPASLVLVSDPSHLVILQILTFVIGFSVSILGFFMTKIINTIYLAAHDVMSL